MEKKDDLLEKAGGKLQQDQQWAAPLLKLRAEPELMSAMGGKLTLGIWLDNPSKR